MNEEALIRDINWMHEERLHEEQCRREEQLARILRATECDSGSNDSKEMHASVDASDAEVSSLGCLSTYLSLLGNFLMHTQNMLRQGLQGC